MDTLKNTPRFDPLMPRFTTASLDEIRQAEELRRRIEQRYLAATHRPNDPYWCVGAD
jgi:hypothetical protein